MEATATISVADADEYDDTEQETTDDNDYEIRTEDHDSFVTVTVWGDLTKQEIVAVGNELYGALTPLDKLPPYSHTMPTVWGLHRRSIAQDTFVRLDAFGNDPSLTYEFSPPTNERSTELGILANDPETAVNAIEKVLDTTIPEKVRDNLL